MESPFEVLGVDEDADEDEVQRAYRERAMEAHPDQGGSAEEFQVVAAAYESIQAEEVADWDEAAARSNPDVVEEEPGIEVVCLDYAAVRERGWSITDPDLFEKAAAAGLNGGTYGEFVLEEGETLLEAAEADGREWPFSCRGGACANCAVAVLEGELEHSIDHVLPPELTDQGIRLSCIGSPVTEDLKVVFNVKDLPGLEELKLPPRPS